MRWRGERKIPTDARMRENYIVWSDVVCLSVNVAENSTFLFSRYWPERTVRSGETFRRRGRFLIIGGYIEMIRLK